MKRIKIALIITITLGTGHAIASGKSGYGATNMADEYLADDSNIASITGSILGGALTAHPIGPVVGSVGGYLIAKLSDFLTRDTEQDRPPSLKAHADHETDNAQLVYFNRNTIPGYFSQQPGFRTAYFSADPVRSYSGTQGPRYSHGQLTTHIAYQPAYYATRSSRNRLSRNTGGNGAVQSQEKASSNSPLPKTEQTASKTVTPNGLRLIRIDQ